MANEREVYDTALAGYQAAYIEEEANYRKAELTGDFSEQTRAFQAMGAHRAAMMGCHTIATDHVASMQRQQTAPTNKFGLSEREIEAAKISRLSEEEYSKNKARLAAMRARGEYATQSQERDG